MYSLFPKKIEILEITQMTMCRILLEHTLIQPHNEVLGSHEKRMRGNLYKLITFSQEIVNKKNKK